MNEELKKMLDSIEGKIENLTKEKGVSEKAVQDELKRLGEEQLKLAKALQESEQKTVANLPHAKANPSIGNAFVGSKAFQGFGSNRKAMYTFKKEGETSEGGDAGTGDSGASESDTPSFTPATTAASNSLTLANVVAPDRRPGLVAMPDRPLIVEDLFPHVPTVSNSVQYLREGSMTNNAAIVAEAGQKPESPFTAPSLQNANIVTVAHWTRITNQLAADAPALAAYINQKLIYGLQSKIDNQLVTGDGSSTQLDGLLHSGNFVNPVTAGYVTASDFGNNDTLFDFVSEVAAALENEAIPPQFLLLNPKDWTALSRLKDGQKRFILGGPQSVATKSLWGIPVKTSASMTRGKYILGNLTLGATIYDRQAIDLAMSDSDDQNFTQNLITIRVERRLGVAYEQPKAIFGGDFAIPTN